MSILTAPTGWDIRKRADPDSLDEDFMSTFVDSTRRVCFVYLACQRDAREYLEDTLLALLPNWQLVRWNPDQNAIQPRNGIDVVIVVPSAEPLDNHAPQVQRILQEYTTLEGVERYFFYPPINVGHIQMGLPARYPLRVFDKNSKVTLNEIMQDWSKPDVHVKGLGSRAEIAMELDALIARPGTVPAGPSPVLVPAAAPAPVAVPVAAAPVPVPAAGPIAVPIAAPIAAPAPAAVPPAVAPISIPATAPAAPVAPGPAPVSAPAPASAPAVVAPLPVLAPIVPPTVPSVPAPATTVPAPTPTAAPGSRPLTPPTPPARANPNRPSKIYVAVDILNRNDETLPKVTRSVQTVSRDALALDPSIPGDGTAMLLQVVETSLPSKKLAKLASKWKNILILEIDPTKGDSNVLAIAAVNFYAKDIEAMWKGQYITPVETYVFPPPWASQMVHAAGAVRDGSQVEGLLPSATREALDTTTLAPITSTQDASLFEVIPVKGDGNCLFHAVTAGRGYYAEHDTFLKFQRELDEGNKTQFALRDELVEPMRKATAERLGKYFGLSLIGPLTTTDYITYARRMAKWFRYPNLLSIGEFLQPLSPNAALYLSEGVAIGTALDAYNTRDDVNTRAALFNATAAHLRAYLEDVARPGTYIGSLAVASLSSWLGREIYVASIDRTGGFAGTYGVWRGLDPIEDDVFIAKREKVKDGLVLRFTNANHFELLVPSRVPVRCLGLQNGHANVLSAGDAAMYIQKLNSLLWDTPSNATAPRLQIRHVATAGDLILCLDAGTVIFGKGSSTEADFEGVTDYEATFGKDYVVLLNGPKVVSDEVVNRIRDIQTHLGAVGTPGSSTSSATVAPTTSTINDPALQLPANRKKFAVQQDVNDPMKLGDLMAAQLNMVAHMMRSVDSSKYTHYYTSMNRDLAPTEIDTLIVMAEPGLVNETAIGLQLDDRIRLAFSKGWTKVAPVVLVASRDEQSRYSDKEVEVDFGTHTLTWKPIVIVFDKDNLEDLIRQLDTTTAKPNAAILGYKSPAINPYVVRVGPPPAPPPLPPPGAGPKKESSKPVKSESAPPSPAPKKAAPQPFTVTGDILKGVTLKKAPQASPKSESSLQVVVDKFKQTRGDDDDDEESSSDWDANSDEPAATAAKQPATPSSQQTQPTPATGLQQKVATPTRPGRPPIATPPPETPLTEAQQKLRQMQAKRASTQQAVLNAQQSPLDPSQSSQPQSTTNQQSVVRRRKGLRLQNTRAAGARGRTGGGALVPAQKEEKDLDVY